MAADADTADRPIVNRPRQVLTWAVIVVGLAALLVIAIEVVRNEPASAPAGRSTDATVWSLPSTERDRKE